MNRNYTHPLIHYYHWYLRATSLCGTVLSLGHWRCWCSLERHLHIKWWCSPLVNIEMYPYWASLVAQLVKNLPAIQETLVRFLGLGRSHGWRHGNSLQYSCLENPHEQRSLVDYSPWGHKELDTTGRLSIALTEKYLHWVKCCFFSSSVFRKNWCRIGIILP